MNQSSEEANELLTSLKEEFGNILTSLDGESNQESVIDLIKTRSNKILSILEKFEFILNKKGLVHNNSNLSNYNHNKGNSMIDIGCIYDNNNNNYNLSGNDPMLLKRLSTAKELRLMPDVAEDGSVRPSQIQVNNNHSNQSAPASTLTNVKGIGGAGPNGMHLVRTSLLNINLAQLGNITSNASYVSELPAMKHDFTKRQSSEIFEHSNQFTHIKSMPSQNAILMNEDGTALAPSVIVTTVNDDSDVWICPKYELTLIQDALNLDTIYDDDEEEEADDNDGSNAGNEDNHNNNNNGSKNGNNGNNRVSFNENNNDITEYKSLSQYKRECWKHMLKSKDLREHEFDEFWEKQVEIAQHIKDIISHNQDIREELKTFQFKLNEIEQSKCNLIDSASNEIEHLRNIIKLLNNQINNNVNGTTNNNNGKKSKRNLSI